MAVNATRRAIQFLVQGALPPHDTNVLWMDTSSPEYPVLKTWENGAWTTVNTSDSKVYNMLIETIYEQQQVINDLSDGVAREETLTQGIEDIQNSFPKSFCYTQFNEESQKVQVIFNEITLQQLEKISIRTNKGLVRFTIIINDSTNDYELYFSNDSPSDIAGQLIEEDAKYMYTDQYIWLEQPISLPSDYVIKRVFYENSSVDLLKEKDTFRIVEAQRQINSLAKQGSNSEATLTQTQTYTQNAATDASNIKSLVQHPVYGLTAIKTEASNAAQDSSTIKAAVQNQNSGLPALGDMLNTVITTMYKGVPINTITYDTQNPPSSITLEPNTWNQLSASITGSGALNITKGAEIANITNIYSLRFTIDSGWTGQLVFKSDASTVWDLSWNGGDVPTWTAGNTYEINILDNIACWIKIEPAT